MRAHWNTHFVHLTKLMSVVIFIIISVTIGARGRTCFIETTAWPRVEECPREYLWKPQAVQNCEHPLAMMGCQNLFLKWLVN